ncbi:MAG: hypothetical protein MK161_17700, partial [Pirellulales bacterium]|nr:hypothetical protein [Pirellulales bacterium]
TEMKDNGNDLRPPISSLWSANPSEANNLSALPDSRLGRNQFLEQQYMFYGTVHWKPSHVFLSQLFSSPMSGDRVTFAKGMLFLPVPRLRWDYTQCCTLIPGRWFGNKATQVPVTSDEKGWVRFTDDISWNLLNQNWQYKLIPTGSGYLKDILTQSPGGWHNEGEGGRGYVPPSFGDLTAQDLLNINTH